MATNSYFRTFDAENDQELLHSIVSESIQVTGYDVNYIPRTLVNEDTILGEDSISEYKDAYSVEMYIKSVDGFEGEGDLVSKFGLEIRDDTTFMISKRRWQNQVDSSATLIKEGRPNEGDLIYVPLMNSFFEIQFVEDQEPFFQLGNLPVYKLRTTKFEYSSEKLSGAIPEISDAEKDLSIDLLQHQALLETGGGTLLESTVLGNMDYLILESDTFNLATQTRDYADNDTYESDAGFGTASTDDDILDFTERNPFGEVDEESI